MPNNYIITCGTSQLEVDKLTGLSYSRDEAERFKAEMETSILSPEGFYKQHQADAVNIFKKLKGMWENLPAWIGRKNNFFGAEISSLVALRHQREEAHGQWKNASATILASDSIAGYFCAEILSLLLEQKCELAEVATKTVPLLKEDPQTQAMIDSAMNNLVDIGFNSLKNHRQIPGIRNTIIITGGFKSTVPCLTLFATLYGIELVYIFENSDQLQTLGTMIDLNNKQNRDEWIKKWKFVLEKGRIDKDSFMYRLINQRVENEDGIYYVLNRTQA